MISMRRRLPPVELVASPLIAIALLTIVPRAHADVVVAPSSCAAECRSSGARDGVWATAPPPAELAGCYQACPGSRVIDAATCANRAPRMIDCAIVPPPAKSETSGVAIGGGIGYQTPILGLQLVFHLTLREARVTFAPWAGGGMWPDIGPFSSGKVYSAFAGGMMVMYGDRHRAVVDFAGAPSRLTQWSSSSCAGGSCTSSSGHKFSYGFTCAVGYEYLATHGFFFRPMVGYTVGGGPTLQITWGARLW